MGIAIPHSLGRNQRFYAVRESTFGTLIRPSATSALKVMRSAMAQTVERINRRDASQSASTVRRTTNKKSVTWSLDAHFMPSGAAGTPPDIHDILRAHFGSYTNTPSTSDVYVHADTQTDRGSLSLTREFNSIGMQAAVGAWVNTIKIAYSGTSIPMITAEGGARDLYHTGYSTLDGEVTASSDTVVVQTADASNFEVGSVIQVGTSNNSAGTPPGHVVTAKTGASLTVSPVISGTQATGLVVAPYVPTETTAGVPISPASCTLTIDGTTVSVVSFEVTSNNNYQVHHDEAGTSLVTDLTPGWRDVSGSIVVRARRDQMLHLGKFRNATSTVRDLAIAIGSTAGSIATIDLNYAEIENAVFDTPEADTCQITLPFYCLGSSGADEFSLTFT